MADNLVKTTRGDVFDCVTEDLDSTGDPENAHCYKNNLSDP